VSQSSNGTETIGYYNAHPQLMGPVIALWTRGFGYDEWSIRLLSLLLTVSATGLFFAAINKAWGLRNAILCCLLFAATPLIYVYGKKLDQEALVTFFLALTCLGYVKFLYTERYGASILFAGFLGMMLSDWAGFVFTGLIGILLVFFTRRDRTRLKAVIWITGLSILFGLAIFLPDQFGPFYTKVIAATASEAPHELAA
jgi:4-amino-4-deoxy-L-arabinose transferase-like glycosyltransferase